MFKIETRPLCAAVLALVFYASVAHAQGIGIGPTPAPFVDLTGVAVSAIGAIGTVITTIFLAWLQGHMKDQAAAATIGAAVKNAVGAVEQAADAGLTSHPLQLKLPRGTSAPTAAGVQYVLDHAGPELTRFTGITLDEVADKVDAQLGLAKLTAPTGSTAALPPAIPPAR